MPGIVTGMDGSDHSVQAVRWAMREAVLRHLPVTGSVSTQVIRHAACPVVPIPGSERP